MKRPWVFFPRRFAPARILKQLSIGLILCTGLLIYYNNDRTTETALRTETSTFVGTRLKEMDQPSVSGVAEHDAGPGSIKSPASSDVFKNQSPSKSPSSYFGEDIGRGDPLANAVGFDFDKNRNNQQPSGHVGKSKVSTNVPAWKFSAGKQKAPLTNQLKPNDTKVLKKRISEENVIESQLNCAHIPPPIEGIRETYEWQNVSKELYVYSAHFDSRPASPVIVIIGVMTDYRRHQYNVRKFGFCSVWYRGETEPEIVDAKVKVLPEDHGFK